MIGCLFGAELLEQNAYRKSLRVPSRLQMGNPMHSGTGSRTWGVPVRPEHHKSSVCHCPVPSWKGCCALRLWLVWSRCYCCFLLFLKFLRFVVLPFVVVAVVALCLIIMLCFCCDLLFIVIINHFPCCGIVVLVFLPLAESCFCLTSC